MQQRLQRILRTVAIAGGTLAIASADLARAQSSDALAGAQGTSSFALREQGGGKAIEITNVIFSTTGNYVPGRPQEERLLLRTTTRTREVIDEKGLEATLTVDAWPLGADPVARPLYSVNVDGVRATFMDNALLVVDRGTEDINWWSIYTLGTGAHLFDTFSPPMSFPPSGDAQTPRYVGFDVPPDDVQDERLRDPKVVGVLAYATPERVIRRLLVTCNDTARAAVLRSYWDTTRELSLLRLGTFADPGAPLSVFLTWRSTASVTPAPPVSMPDAASIPIANDDLDVAHAQLPACIALAPWSP
jgi:hypothetical protein